MSADTVALVGALVYEHPALRPVLAEHLDRCDGEVLAHLFLADLAGWLDRSAHVAPATCRQVGRWLETAYLRGSAEVRELIATSLPTLVPDRGEPLAA